VSELDHKALRVASLVAGTVAVVMLLATMSSKPPSGSVWHVTGRLGVVVLYDFYTTNDTYTGVEWTTNYVPGVGVVVDGQMKQMERRRK